MTERELSTEDVAAMRREGDLPMVLRQAIRGGQARQRAALKSPAPRPRTAEGHTAGAWPVAASDGAPGRIVCDCPDCTALAAGRPPLEELLRTVDQDETPESA